VDTAEKKLVRQTSNEDTLQHAQSAIVSIAAEIASLDVSARLGCKE
jgi:hypothetical protein